MKKSVLLLTLILLCLCTGLTSASAQMRLGGGSGTQSDPFRIKTATHLDSIRLNGAYQAAGLYFQIDNDITVNDPANTVTPVFTPIANFQGTIDGQKHSIVWKGAVPQSSNGLFEAVANATIKNIFIIKPDILGTSATGTGALAGRATGDVVIENCYIVGGSVDGQANGFTGGLIGNVAWGPASLRITNSYSTASVTSTGLHVGGLIGYINALPVEITNCHAFSAVSGANNTGGLIGTLNGPATITKAYATGSVTSAGINVGGLIGEAGHPLGATTITDSYSMSDIVGSPIGYVGGLVGHFVASPSATIERSFAFNNSLTTAATASQVGGLVGASDSPLKINSCQSTVAAISGASYLGGLVGIASVAGNEVINSIATATVIGTGGSVGGLIGETSDITMKQAYSKGTKIDGAATEVGGLVGKIVGARSSISTSMTDGAIGTITATGVNTGGLVGHASTDLAIDSCLANGVSISSAAGNVGGLVGWLGGTTNTITNSVAGATTLTGAGTNVGGLVGLANNVDITNCSGASTLTNTGNNTGGLVGSITGIGNITSSTSNTNISVPTGSTLGGLVGYANILTVKGCVVPTTLQVSGTNNIGGVVGQVQGSGFISGVKLASGATVTGSGSNIGGIVGVGNSTTISNSQFEGALNAALATGPNVGGLAGSLDNGSNRIVSSAFTGATFTVPATGQFIGGLVGNMVGGAIDSSYVSSPITITGGSDYVGGLAGSLTNTDVQLSYSNAKVNLSAANAATFGVGGFAGVMIGSSIINSYAQGNVTIATPAALASVGGLVGSTDATSSIATSYASGAVVVNGGTGAWNQIGGLVGKNYSNITNCFASGNVTSTASAGTSYIGGLVGTHHSGLISGSNTLGDVIAYTLPATLPVGGIGGIAGWMNANISNVTAVGTKIGSAPALAGTLHRISGAWAGGSISTGLAASDMKRFEDGVGVLDVPDPLTNPSANTLGGGSIGIALTANYRDIDVSTLPVSWGTNAPTDIWAVPGGGNLPTLAHVGVPTPVPSLPAIVSPAIPTTGKAAVYVGPAAFQTLCPDENLGDDLVSAILPSLDFNVGEAIAGAYSWTITGTNGTSITGSGATLNGATTTATALGTDLVSYAEESFDVTITAAPSNPLMDQTTVTFPLAKSVLNPTVEYLTQQDTTLCEVVGVTPPTAFDFRVKFSGAAPWTYTLTGTVDAGSPYGSRLEKQTLDSIFMENVTPAGATYPSSTKTVYEILAGDLTDGNGCIVNYTDPPRSQSEQRNVYVTPIPGSVAFTPALTDSVFCEGTSVTIPSPILEGIPTGVNATTEQHYLVWEYANAATSNIGLPASDSTALATDPLNLPLFTATTLTQVYADTAKIIAYGKFVNTVGGVCMGDTMNKTLTVNPLPSIALGDTTQIVCNGSLSDTIRIISKTDDMNTKFIWENRNPGIGLTPVAKDSMWAYAANGKAILPFVTANSTRQTLIDSITIKPVFINNGVRCYASPVDTVLATLEIDPITTIEAQPEAITICDPAILSYELKVGAYGADVTYQWYKDNAKIENATASTYTATENGNYFVQVGGRHCGNPMSDTVRVDFYAAPTFASNLVDSAAVCKGGDYTFKVKANGIGYQWYYEDIPLSSTSDTLTIHNVTQEQTYGYYKVVALSACGNNSESVQQRLWIVNPLTTPINIESDNVAYVGKEFRVSVSEGSQGLTDVTYYTWSNKVDQSAQIDTTAKDKQYYAFITFGNAVGKDTIQVVMNHICGTNGVYVAQKEVSVELYTAIDDVTTKATVVYPNPVASELHINAESTIKSVTVANVNGHYVFSKSNINDTALTVDAGAWSAGSYVVTITTADGTTVHKIIKN